MSGSRLRPYLGPLAALLVVVALGAGTVYAAIPNGSGTYYACRVKDNGAVRLINYPKVKTCPKGQKLISWSATGPAGPAGPADWNAIPNKPVGFADGVDDDGVTAVRIRTVTSTSPTSIVPSDIGEATADCPTGFLAVGGGWDMTGPVALSIYRSKALDADTWLVAAYNYESAFTATLTAQVTCLRAEPAGLVIAAKNSNFGPKKSKVRLPQK